jgi:hypothetical protein
LRMPGRTAVADLVGGGFGFMGRLMGGHGALSQVKRKPVRGNQVGRGGSETGHAANDLIPVYD